MSIQVKVVTINMTTAVIKKARLMIQAADKNEALVQIVTTCHLADKDHTTGITILLKSCINTKPQTWD